MDDLEAREWLGAWLERRGFDWEKLTPAERFLLTREIPCFIRCWRVGVAVDVKPGERCSECGKLCPKPTFWEKLPLPV